MIRPPLSDQAIRALTPPEKGYRIVWDGSLKGFGCRISQAGTRAFVVLVESGRPHTIGRYGPLSLSAARTEARKLLAQKTLGRDFPTRTAFVDAVEAFLSECRTRNRPKTVSEYQRLLKRLDFGRTAIADVTGKDILRKLKALDNTPTERLHLFTASRRFFNWAMRQHMVDVSPMQRLATPPVPASRERVLSENELEAVYLAARALQTPMQAIICLCLLTGQRRSEIGALEWSWIEKDTITFPKTITKNNRTHVIPVGPLAQQVLSELPRFTSPYVFPSRNHNPKVKHFNNWATGKATFDKALEGVEPFTLHDLRRTFSTGLAALGVEQIVAEKLLNHVSGGSQSQVARIYNRHAYLDEMRTALLKWEHFLSNLISSGTPV